MTLFQLSLSDFQISRGKFNRNEIIEKDYKESLGNILTYLNTAKEILKLDQLVTPNAILYGRLLDQIEMTKDSLNSLT